jgi:hypothetical protein
MNQSTSSRFWAVLGAGILVIAGVGIMLAVLGRGPGENAPIPPSPSPVPADNPVVATVGDRSIDESLWTETVLLDQVMSGMAGQPAPTPEETLERLINEELVLQAVPPEQAPATEQVEARIATLEQTWEVDDATLVRTLEKVGLTRAAFERVVGRLLAVEASLETLQRQGYDTTAWLEEQRASVDIMLNEELENVMAVPYIPIAQSTVATPLPSPLSPLPVPATETPQPQTYVVPASMPTPTPDFAIPEVAPDFTLQRANGGEFTLSEQLAQGPVVLIFFQKCG